MNSLLQSLNGVGSVGGVGGASPIEKPDLVSIAPAGEAAKINGQGFGEVMGDIASSTVGKLKQAEYVSLAAVKGEANTRQVVDSLMAAEQSLQTAIAIRDKIVTAYLDVTRMQI